MTNLLTLILFAACLLGVLVCSQVLYDTWLRGRAYRRRANSKIERAIKDSFTSNPWPFVEPYPLPFEVPTPFIDFTLRGDGKPMIESLERSWAEWDGRHAEERRRRLERGELA